MVIATKFTGGQYQNLGDKIIQSNFSGNSSKNILISFKRSLKNLRTDYIDLYYVRLYDYTTSVPELMNMLNTLVTSRQVLYLGISDTPAWLVVKCNDYARQHDLRPFSVYQGRFGAGCRDLEREIIPMCMSESMGLAPWGVLGGGGFKNAEVKEKEGVRSLQVGSKTRDEKLRSVLEKVAEKKGSGATSVALAYVLHKAPYVFPIIGGRKVEYLGQNIEALKLKLDANDMAAIDAAYGFEIGFPHDFLSGGNNMVLGPENNAFNDQGGYFGYPVSMKPTPPHEGPVDKL
ncbi:Aldo/keto reductase [Bimuria novae-zelandiae CBS 107.79]|uniref:Aldo/keto reductase n=1 Tax=Bimuria novae-zelandiae CBS 107.79 TaxID=1447943 RepID=A0A6A5VWQ3_9PLEO|nr:Aldo/keto reductase [Bimuria novae-zelandiae CBS 107.79]